MAASMSDMFCLSVSPVGGNAVKVRFINSVKGKGLFATKNICKGETIFQEKPLVSSQFLWNALYRYRACDHCLRALETAEENARRLSGNACLVLPHPEQCHISREQHQACPNCQVVYCSVACRTSAQEQYHQSLCLGASREDPKHPLNKLQEAWRNIHYPPETASIMLMARMVATVKQAKDKDRWVNYFSQFCNKTTNEEEEIVHKLLGDKFKGQLDLLRALFVEALYEERLSRWFTPEGFQSLFALVGTNGQGIGSRGCRYTSKLKALAEADVKLARDRALHANEGESSLSQWVHGCDALELSVHQREQLDSFIDQLYKDIEKGFSEVAKSSNPTSTGNAQKQALD